MVEYCRSISSLWPKCISVTYCTALKETASINELVRFSEMLALLFPRLLETQIPFIFVAATPEYMTLCRKKNGGQFGSRRMFPFAHLTVVVPCTLQWPQSFVVQLRLMHVSTATSSWWLAFLKRLVYKESQSFAQQSDDSYFALYNSPAQMPLLFFSFAVSKHYTRALVCRCSP